MRRVDLIFRCTSPTQPGKNVRRKVTRSPISISLISYNTDVRFPPILCRMESCTIRLEGILIMRRFLVQRSILGVLAILVSLNIAASVQAEEATAAVETRLLDAVKYLASDELEGRGVGSAGLDKAAEYVREQFAAAGLKVEAVDGGAFQPFEMTIRSELGKKNELVLSGPDGKSVSLKIDADFSPLSFGGSGQFSAPVVFVGYGIDAEDKKYNDFADIDIKDKIVIVMRRTPQQGNPHGNFSGGPHGGVSKHAALRTKVANAYGAGAAAVLFVNDPHSGKTNLKSAKKRVDNASGKVAEAAVAFDAVDPQKTEEVKAARKKLSATIKTLKSRKADFAKGAPDDLMKFGYGGNSEQHSIPLLHITRAACDTLLVAAGTSLEKLEKQIDKDLKPRSMEIKGWTASGEVSVKRVKAQVKNVIGVLEGEGPLANETVVVGAHYDHVGRGGEGSLSPGSMEIHNGADDNASGAAALIELARRLGARQEKPPRRMVFIAFTAEERGLIGSAHYVKDPLFSLENTVAMINMDMVGRLKDDKLTVFGSGTAPRWDALIDRLGKEYGFKITKKPDGFGPSDHSSFYGKKIPVLHFFTGTHSDYHRPGDDWEKINPRGMRRVVNMIADVILDTSTQTERPKYVAVKSSGNHMRSGSRPYFGSIPDFANETPGYALMGVSPGSPADKGGLKAGDVIVEIDKKKIGNLSDFDLALRKFKGGDTIKVVVQRGKEKVQFEVILDKPR